MSGTQRLANLLELANQGPAMRAALAEEVADLLANWPGDCPIEMRAPCEALLTRARREMDDGNAAGHEHPDTNNPPREPQERALIEAARSGEAIAPYIARALGISQSLALGILCDESGFALVVAAKSLGLRRAAFSSLALLSCPVSDETASYKRLEAFDAVSAVEAAHQLRLWNAKISHAA